MDIGSLFKQMLEQQQTKTSAAQQAAGQMPQAMGAPVAPITSALQAPNQNAMAPVPQQPNVKNLKVSPFKGFVDALSGRKGL